MQWLVVGLLRVVVPLSIFRWPLPGSILAIIADNLDVVILDLLGAEDFGPYNRVDKLLDTYLYVIQGYTMLSWESLLARNVGVFLLVYRIVGVVLYELSDARVILFVFPNVFILYYLFYLGYRKLMHDDPFSKPVKAITMLCVLLILKLSHEYLLHVAQFPFYRWIRDHVITPIVQLSLLAPSDSGCLTIAMLG